MDNKQSRNVECEQKKETIFKSQQKEVYRIPALFCEREKKTLLAFAEKRRTSDDSSTEALVMKTGTVNKDETTQKVTIEWSQPSTLVKKDDLDGYRPMNPCPVYEKNSKILFLFFICVEGSVTERCQIKHYTNKARLCYITSDDLGQSWSTVTYLTYKLAEIKTWATFAVGPGHGIQTESGRLIVPVYAYNSCFSSCWWCCCELCCSPTPYALYLYSDDKGTLWQFGNMLQTESLECEMAEFVDDKGIRSIYCNARSKGGNRVEALETEGAFKILPSTEKLVETGGGCQGSVVSFPAQTEPPSQGPNKWLLFTHPTKKCKRIDLGVYLNKSPQDRNAWSKPWIINRGPSGYSDLAYIDDGWFACLMECGKTSEIEQIALQVFSYNEVEQGI